VLRALPVVGWNSVAYSTIPLELSRFMVEYATLFHPTINISYSELRAKTHHLTIVHDCMDNRQEILIYPVSFP
jgi:hypothetical protein